MSATTLAAAMERAGVDITKPRVYQIAVDIARKNSAASDQGFSAFEAAIRNRPDMERPRFMKHGYLMRTSSPAQMCADHGGSGGCFWS